MTHLRRILLGLGVLVTLGWAVIPESALYTEVFTPRVILGMAGLLKLMALGSGGFYGLVLSRRFEADNPARRGWVVVGLGLVLMFLGQLSLAPYQLFDGSSPYPSVADVFFVAAYPLLVFGFVALLLAYKQVGFPIGTARLQGLVVTLVFVSGVAFSLTVLLPLFQADAPPLEKALNVGYPLLDLVLLGPLALLFVATARFGASAVGWVWLTVIAGFFFTCVGDVVFAYFAMLELEMLDPYLHATFILGYGLVADGVGRQAALLR